MILVLAYGNPLRGDDGVGWVIGEELERTLRGAQVILRHQLVPELAEDIAGARAVIFVDARRGVTPGRVSSSPLTGAAAAVPMGHAHGPEALLGLAAEVFGRVPPAFLVSVDVGGTDFGTELTNDVAAAVPTACAEIQRLAQILDRAEPLPRTAE